VSWVDSAGRRDPRIDLTGAESWLTEPGGSIGVIVPVWPGGGVLSWSGGHLGLSGQRVRAAYLETLGVSPIRGRDIGGPGDVLISHRLWVSRFGGDPGVLERPIDLDGRPARIVGVAPPGFDGPLCCAPPDFWAFRPVSAEPTAAFLAVVGPVDGAAAEAWLTGIDRGAAAAARASLARAESAPWGGETGIVGRSLLVLLGLALVAWIGTVVSGMNLLLADTLGRRSELRLRSALGSRPGDLVLRTFAETFWLAASSAAVALLLTWIMVEAAPWFLPMLGGPDYPNAVEVEVGTPAFGAILAMAAAVSLAAATPAAIAGLALARTASVERGPRGDRFASVGLGAQVALAGVLLVVAGLFVGSIRSLDGDFVGFRHGTTRVDYLTRVDTARALMASRIIDAVRPNGSRRVAVSRRLPVYGAARDSVGLPDGTREHVVVEMVTPSFYETVGTRLMAGDPADRPDQGVVSADLAVRIAGSPNAAIGATLLVADTMAVTITGVVEEATWGSGSVRPTVYRGWGEEAVSRAVLLTASSPDGASVRGLLATLQPLGLAVESFGTLDGLLVRTRILSVFLSRLALAFGLLCLGVALASVHAFFLRWVRVRRRSLAIRSALGARNTTIGGHVIRSALRVVIPAIALGLAGGWAASRLLAAVLEGTPPAGPALLAVIAAGLLAAALGALAVPLVQAGAADPAALLRTD
jgi:hypothetical protein